MAAVVCRWLCVKPCEACNVCCSQLCEWLEQCCDGLCEGCARCCTTACSWCGDVCTACSNCCDKFVTWINAVFEEPFSGCLAITVLLNLSPLVVGVSFLSQDSDQDCNFTSIFVIVSLILFVVHITFGCYMYHHLKQKRYDPATAGQTETTRTKEFLLENPVFAVYIFIFMFAFAWAIVGLVEASRCVNGDHADSSKDLAVAAEAIGIVSLVFYGIAFCIFFSNLLVLEDACEDCNPLACLCCCCYPCFGWLFELDSDQRRRRREQRRETERRQREERARQRMEAKRADRAPLAPQNDDIVVPVAVEIDNSAPPPGANSMTWTCPACTLTNPPAALRCQACNAPRQRTTNASPAPAAASPSAPPMDNPPGNNHVLHAQATPAQPQQQENKPSGGLFGAFGSALNQGLKFLEDKINEHASKDGSPDAKR